jgi:site-specific recombinase XerD
MATGCPFAGLIVDVFVASKTYPELCVTYQNQHMLSAITLSPLYHRAKECIAIFYNDLTLNNTIKCIPNIRWSRTHRCWYLPLSRAAYEEIKHAMNGIAELNTAPLKWYLEQRKAVQPMQGSKPQEEAGVSEQPISRQRSKIIMQYPLSTENLHAFTQFQGMIRLKGYSPNTMRTYCNELHLLLRLLGRVAISTLTKNHVQSYLLWLIKTKGYSETHIHTTVNALKFYFEQVEGRAREFYDLPRPKKPSKLPQILAEEEVVSLIMKTGNLKHRALLMTSYSAGLRVSELVNLKIGDIDSKRMMLHIRCGKGKKDRMVPLSKVLLQTLRDYFVAFRPKDYLFEGGRGTAYSTRSAQKVLHQAKRKAGIHKAGSIHSLRHAYATHLLEGGTDVRYIQSFLGHSSLKTTMRYTQVSRIKVEAIGSPLDKLPWGNRS